MLVLLSVTAGPIGAAVIVRSTVLSKPYFGSRVIFAVPELPAVIVSESTLVVNVKSGVPGAGAVTVTATLVVWVTGPLVPVMVTMFFGIGPPSTTIPLSRKLPMKNRVRSWSNCTGYSAYRVKDSHQF